MAILFFKHEKLYPAGRERVWSNFILDFLCVLHLEAMARMVVHFKCEVINFFQVRVNDMKVNYFF